VTRKRCVGFVTAERTSTALKVKYHPILSDDQKLKRISTKYVFTKAWLVGKYPVAGFEQFVWSGLIF
jgi:hypothetical protein